jgi:hypothetical protein
MSWQNSAMIAWAAGSLRSAVWTATWCRRSRKRIICTYRPVGSPVVQLDPTCSYTSKLSQPSFASVARKRRSSRACSARLSLGTM